MVVSEHWRYQGRQYHQWFGHGTAPREEKEARPAKPGSLFDPLSVGQRIDYLTGSVIAHSPRDERSRWEARLSGASRDSLKTAVAVSYGASGMSQDGFRQKLLDPSTADETVDQLRRAAKGVVDARTHAELTVAGESLARAAQTVGVDRWPRFLGDAERRGVAAVSDEAIPGVVKASAAGTDMTAGAVGLRLVLLLLALKNQGASPARPAAPSKPSIVRQAPPEKDAGGPRNAAPENLAKPGDATLAEDRGKYILDGNGRGGGGHGPGRATPDKSTFPSDWSDEKTIEAIKDIANDPASIRTPADGGRTSVEGTRDGVNIRVIIGRDGKAIVTAYPTNILPGGE